MFVVPSPMKDSLMATTKVATMYDEYETDSDLENEGTWVEIRGGAQVKIRADSSDIARDYANKLAKKQRNILAASNWVLPPKMQDRNEVLMCVHAYIVDWKNVTNRAGEVLPFNKTNIELICTDLRQFRHDVLYAARTDETFRAVREDLEGNSAAPSKQSSSSADAATT